MDRRCTFMGKQDKSGVAHGNQLVWAANKGFHKYDSVGLFHLHACARAEHSLPPWMSPHYVLPVAAWKLLFPGWLLLLCCYINIGCAAQLLLVLLLSLLQYCCSCNASAFSLLLAMLLLAACASASNSAGRTLLQGKGGPSSNPAFLDQQVLSKQLDISPHVQHTT